MLSTFAESIVATWKRTRLWFAGLFIAGYLTILAFGLFCHAFQWNQADHPAMYYVVWDMFCGWSGYVTRYHVLAEGVSGDYYEVVPGPWGEYVPYGDIGRRHYDSGGVHSTRMAMNVLRQTSHEPIARIFVVEETWAKKYNMPDAQWAARWDQPKEPFHYFTPRHVVTAEGQLLMSHDCFYQQNSKRATYSNPRLVQEASRAQPFYTVGEGSGSRYRSAGLDTDLPGARIGSPLGL